MSKLWREAEFGGIWKDPKGDEKVLVPVEPVGTLTVEGEGFWLAGLRFSDQLPPGNYWIVKADDE